MAKLISLLTALLFASICCASEPMYSPEIPGAVPAKLTECVGGFQRDKPAGDEVLDKNQSDFSCPSSAVKIHSERSAEGDFEYQEITIKDDSDDFTLVYGCSFEEPQVYVGDLNGDGRPDYLFLQGCGSMWHQWVAVALSSRGSYKAYGFYASYFNLKDAFFKGKKTATFIQSEQKQMPGNGHAFWLNRFFDINGPDISASKRFEPVIIQYTHKENHKVTRLLSLSQRQEVLKNPNFLKPQVLPSSVTDFKLHKSKFIRTEVDP
jgi:hypothetical protein